MYQKVSLKIYETHLIEAINKITKKYLKKMKRITSTKKSPKTPIKKKKNRTKTGLEVGQNWPQNKQNLDDIWATIGL